MDQASAKPRQKETLYQLFAQIGQALANAHRLELLDLLLQAPYQINPKALAAQEQRADKARREAPEAIRTALFSGLLGDWSG